LTKRKSRRSIFGGNGEELVEYSRGDEEGAGTFGTVYKCLNVLSGQSIAVKSIKVRV
jgi:hypothetical protein